MLSFAPEAPCDAWLGQLDALARSRLGRSASDNRALAHAVAELSRAYTRRAGALRDPARDPDDLWARLSFFLPRDLAKVQLPLLELYSVGALPRRDRKETATASP